MLLFVCPLPSFGNSCSIAFFPLTDVSPCVGCLLAPAVALYVLLPIDNIDANTLHCRFCRWECKGPLKTASTAPTTAGGGRCAAGQWLSWPCWLRGRGRRNSPFEHFRCPPGANKAPKQELHQFACCMLRAEPCPSRCGVARPLSSALCACCYRSIRLARRLPRVWGHR